MSYFVDLIDKVQKLGWIAEYEECGEIGMQSSRKWTDPTTADISCPHDEACSKASGLTPPR